MAKSPKSEADREPPILTEIVVDAYGADERAMGWYCYLEEKLGFPFTARCGTISAARPHCRFVRS